MSRFIKNILIKITLGGGLLLGVKSVHATDIAYTGTFAGTEGLATKTGQTSTATYTRDMNKTGDRVSMQVTYSSFTYSSQTFTDGSTSTGTITVSSNSYVVSSTPTISINGINIAYTPQATSSATAKNISDYIMATSALNSIIVSTWAGTTTGIVYTTSTAVGTAKNYTMLTSSQAALGVSAATMLGGTNSAYTISTPTITIASNGFVTGLQVLYSTGSGTAISGLTTGTTYYVCMVSPNATTGLSSTFKLSTTLALAQTGTGIVLASSQTKTTADTFTLAPLAFTNAGGGIQLQWSDDNLNWTNATTGNYGLTITSVTFSAAGGTSLYDLGPIQHRYLRLNETPPTTGAATYTATDNERYSNIH